MDPNGTWFDKFFAQKSIWGKWANYYDSVQLQGKTIPLN